MIEQRAADIVLATISRWHEYVWYVARAKVRWSNTLEKNGRQREAVAVTKACCKNLGLLGKACR